MRVGGKAKKELIGLSSGPNDLSGFIKVDLKLDFENQKVKTKENFTLMTLIFGALISAIRATMLSLKNFKHMVGVQWLQP